MNNNAKLIAMSLALLSASTVFGQKILRMEDDPLLLNYFGNQWAEYEKKEIDNNLFKVSNHYFRDTVSVEEMKEAFYKYKDVKKDDRPSPYDGFEVFVPSLNRSDKYAVISSPLETRPAKSKKQKKEVKENKNREVLMLRKPRWYMGFVVSADARLRVYDDGKMTSEAPHADYPDFFSYASYNPFIQLDGSHNWAEKINYGTKLMAAFHGLTSTSNSDSGYDSKERVFSVLLYTKDAGTSYTLELLEPQIADPKTRMLFRDLKQFVERIPSKTYAPLFTADKRLMTGRYYRVTANKQGWQIKDYMNITPPEVLEPGTVNNLFIINGQVLDKEPDNFSSSYGWAVYFSKHQQSMRTLKWVYPYQVEEKQTYEEKYGVRVKGTITDCTTVPDTLCDAYIEQHPELKQTYRHVEGVVLDLDGKPLYEAIVHAKGQRSKCTVTDSTGHFSFWLPRTYTKLEAYYEEYGFMGTLKNTDTTITDSPITIQMRK